MEKQYIVVRQVGSTHLGVILHFVKTTTPVGGELIYFGEFISRTATWGLNEPVRADILEPMGEVASEIFDAQAVPVSDEDRVVIYALNSEPARNWMNQRSRQAFESRKGEELHWSAGKKACDAKRGNSQEDRLIVVEGPGINFCSEPMPVDFLFSLCGGGSKLTT